MSEGAKTPRPRRYRKKNPMEPVEAPELQVNTAIASNTTPKSTPRKKYNRNKSKSPNEVDKLGIRMQQLSPIEPDDIVEMRKNRATQLIKKRELHQQQMEERKKREKAQELMIKRVEEETVNKLVRAEVMFTLFQEHTQQKAKPTSPNADVHQETYPFGFNPASLSPDVLFPRIKRWEEQLKRLCQRGSYQVNAHNDPEQRGIACLREACRDSYMELLLHHTEISKKMDVNERLWMNWYREIDPVQSAFREATGQHDALTLMTVRDTLTVLLAKCTSFYNKLLLNLKTLSPSNACTFAIHLSMVALGDLARYSQNLLPKNQRNWNIAASHYRNALMQLPSNGKVFNQLALLSLHQGNTFEACYLYCRSLACTTPFCARENLMTALGKAYDIAKKQVNMPFATLPEAVSSFQTRFLACMSVLYTGIDVVRHEPDFAKCLDALTSVTKFISTSSDEMENVQLVLVQSVVFAIFSVHNTQVSIGLPEIQEPHFDTEWKPWRENEVVHVALSFCFRISTLLLEAIAQQPSESVLNTVLPAINIFLDWLRSHTWFMDFENDAVVELQLQLVQTLVQARLKRDEQLNDHWDGHQPALSEDLDLRGFLPYANVLIRRFSSDSSIQNASNHQSISNISIRLARLFGFVDCATTLGWMPRNAATSVAPRLTCEPVIADRLCPHCSNSIVSSSCEFCGYDSTEGEKEEVQSPPTARRGGLLSGVQLNVPKPAPKRSTKARTRAVVEFGGLSYASPNDPKCLIVVDAANVAMRHGLNKRFSCKGIRLVFDYYLARGHKVIAFLPDYLLTYESVGAQKRMAGYGFDVNPSKMPDDVALLQSMVLEGTVIATPPQDYDDSYCIQYAGHHDGCVVTNDLFRDHVEGMNASGQKKAAMRQWLAAHRISFTWVGDEFFPNPDFRFPAPNTASLQE